MESQSNAGVSTGDSGQVITELVPTWDSYQDIALDTEARDVDSYQGIASAIPKDPQINRPFRGCVGVIAKAMT